MVIHHSILSEGINVNGLEAVLFMRNMDCIGISQSIGRVIRLGDRHKTFGLVCVPVYDKVGVGTARSVQAVVDTVFEQGQPRHLYYPSLIMKVKVQLFKAGKVFDEIVIATDYEDARQVALARNPGASVISVTAVF